MTFETIGWTWCGESGNEEPSVTENAAIQGGIFQEILG